MVEKTEVQGATNARSGRGHPLSGTKGTWVAPFDSKARFILRLRLTRVPPDSRGGTCPWHFPAAKLVLPEKEHSSIIKFLTPTITCGPDPCASRPVFLQHPVPLPVLDPPVRPSSPRHLRGAGPLPRLAPKSGKKADRKRGRTTSRIRLPELSQESSCGCNVK